MNGKLSFEAGCPWPQYSLKAKVSCGSVAMLYVVFVSAGGATQGALCHDSVVASSSGPDIGHGEAPASASSVKVNVAADRMQIYALLSEFVILLLDISNRE